MELLTFGTQYARNIIPDKILNENSVYYGFGTGEDISFDIELIEKYNCNAFIFDPTPRAINFYKDKHLFYPNTKEEVFNKIAFFDYGIWDKDVDIKFYEPQNKTHVSHSIDNLQKTDCYFIGKVKTLSTIMKELRHDKIDLLKLDIEGAEYKVIDDILNCNINMAIFVAEFHKSARENLPLKINEQIELFSKHGYSVVARVNDSVTLLKDNL